MIPTKTRLLAKMRRISLTFVSDLQGKIIAQKRIIKIFIILIICFIRFAGYLFSVVISAANCTDTSCKSEI